MEYANKDEWCYALQAELTRTKRALEIAMTELYDYAAFDGLERVRKELGK